MPDQVLGMASAPFSVTSFIPITETPTQHLTFECLQHWLDPAKRVSQQIKGVSPITLYLGVKFYAADPCKLVEEITRYQFFLQVSIILPQNLITICSQVKLDILQGRLPVPQELATELAALALQCKSLTCIINLPMQATQRHLFSVSSSL